jgi:hypothetical protein
VFGIRPNTVHTTLKSLPIFLFCLLLVACRQAAIIQTFDSPEYGIHTAMWWNVRDDGIPEVKLAQEMGFGWVKQNFAWRDIEGGEKGQYNSYRPDRIVDEINAAGLKLVVRLDRPPLWAMPTDRPLAENGPPANNEDFRDYCRWLATRYKGRIHAYQVWNEPNLDREWNNEPPNAAAYVELLRVCYESIKSADPAAIIISAALAPTGTYTEQVIPDDIFLQQMYDAGASDYFDILGVNAPGYAAPPEASPEEVANPDNPFGGHRVFAFRHVEDIREIMVKNGDGARQIAIMEMGWVTNDAHGATDQTLDVLHNGYSWYAVDEATQADYLVRAYQYAEENWSPWIGLMTTIFLADTAWTPEANEQWWWSITLPDGTHRPAFDALSNMPKKGD